MPAVSLSKLSEEELAKKKTTTLIVRTLISSEFSNKMHGFIIGGYIKIKVNSEGFLISLSRAGDRSFKWSFSHVRGVGRPRTTEINGFKLPFEKLKPGKQQHGLKSASPTNMDRILNTAMCHLSFVFPGCRIYLYLTLSDEYDHDFQWKRALSGLIVDKLVLNGNGDEGFEQVMNNVRVNKEIINNCEFKNNKFDKKTKLRQQPDVIWCRSAGWLNTRTIPTLTSGKMRFIMKRLDENWIKSFFQYWKRSRNCGVDKIKAVVFVHPRRNAAAIAEFQRFLWNDLRGQAWNGPKGDYQRETGTNIIVDCRYGIVIRRKHLSGIVATVGGGYTVLVVD